MIDQSSEPMALTLNGRPGYEHVQYVTEAIISVPLCDGSARMGILIVLKDLDAEPIA